MPTVAITRPYKIVGGIEPALGEAIAHAVDRLTHTPVTRTPFAHALVADFLPGPLFAALRESFPSSETGLRSVRERRGDPLYSEQRFSHSLPPPNDPESATLPEPIATVQRLLCSDRIVGTLLAMFEDSVAARTAVVADEKGLATVPLTLAVELVYDRSGFELIPHTDGRRKLVTGLLYVADPDDPEELGTQLYAPSDPRTHSDGNGSVPRNLVRPVTRAPYRPNLFLCFGRTDQSFHGVEATDSDRPRRLIQFSIMTP